MQSVNKKGFTLIEILIVIIIIGVLASLALPRFFKTVEYSRGTEALTSLSSLRQSMGRCYLKGTSFINCAMGNLDVDDPSGAVRAHFSYTIIAPGASTFVLRATRNTLDGGTAGETITITDDGTRNGSGNFAGI